MPNSNSFAVVEVNTPFPCRVGLMGRNNWYEFRPQSEFPRFAEIQASVPAGTRWQDETNIAPGRANGSSLAYKSFSETARVKEAGVTPFLFKQASGDAAAMDATDIEQGAIGNCWFMAAISSVAEAGFAHSLFSNVDNDKGIYEVRLWKPKTHSPEGPHLPSVAEMEPFYVCVDDRIWVNPDRNDAAYYCYSDEVGEMWSSLVEKAFAKACAPTARDPDGGYSVTDGGVVATGVYHLIGSHSLLLLAPSSRQLGAPFCEDAPALASHIKDRLVRGHILGVSWHSHPGLPVGTNGEASGPEGLVLKHAYSVFDVRDVPLANGGTETLVWVRNPWGSRNPHNPNLEWTGDWSDNSPLWAQNPAAKAACSTGIDGRMTKAKDGMFWMPASAIAKYAESFDVCIPRGTHLCDSDYEFIKSRFCRYCGSHDAQRLLLFRGDLGIWHHDCLKCVKCGTNMAGGSVKAIRVSGTLYPDCGGCNAGDKPNYLAKFAPIFFKPPTTNRKHENSKYGTILNAVNRALAASRVYPNILKVDSAAPSSPTSARGGATLLATCNLCGKGGHTAKEHTCAKCGESGTHAARDCPAPAETPPAATCDLCGKPGHPTAKHACSLCGANHKRADCPDFGRKPGQPPKRPSPKATVKFPQVMHIRVRCGLCGVIGHPSNLHVCQKCGQQGHTASSHGAEEVKPAESVPKCGICDKVGHATETHKCSVCLAVGKHKRSDCPKKPKFEANPEEPQFDEETTFDSRQERVMSEMCSIDLLAGMGSITPKTLYFDCNLEADMMTDGEFVLGGEHLSLATNVDAVRAAVAALLTARGVPGEALEIYETIVLAKVGDVSFQAEVEAFGLDEGESLALAYYCHDLSSVVADADMAVHSPFRVVTDMFLGPIVDAELLALRAGIDLDVLMQALPFLRSLFHGIGKLPVRRDRKMMCHLDPTITTDDAANRLAGFRILMAPLSFTTPGRWSVIREAYKRSTGVATGLVVSYGLPLRDVTVFGPNPTDGVQQVPEAVVLPSSFVINVAPEKTIAGDEQAWMLVLTETQPTEIDLINNDGMEGDGEEGDGEVVEDEWGFDEMGFDDGEFGMERHGTGDKIATDLPSVEFEEFDGEDLGFEEDVIAEILWA